MYSVYLALCGVHGQDISIYMYMCGVHGQGISTYMCGVHGQDISIYVHVHCTRLKLQCTLFSHSTCPSVRIVIADPTQVVLY